MSRCVYCNKEIGTYTGSYNTKKGVICTSCLTNRTGVKESDFYSNLERLKQFLNQDIEVLEQDIKKAREENAVPYYGIYNCAICGREHDSNKLRCYPCKDGKICESCMENLIGKSAQKFCLPQYKEIINSIALLDAGTLKQGNIEKALETVKEEAKAIEEKKIEMQKAAAEEEEKRAQELEAQRKERDRKGSSVVISTGDINRDYEIIGPVYFFGSIINEYKSITDGQYQRFKAMHPYCEELKDIKQGTDGMYQTPTTFTGFVSKNIIPYLCFEKLKEIAENVGADAVINVKFDSQVSEAIIGSGLLSSPLLTQDKHIESIYGTAVRFKC